MLLSLLWISWILDDNVASTCHIFVVGELGRSRHERFVPERVERKLRTADWRSTTRIEQVRGKLEIKGSIRRMRVQ